MDPLQRNNVHIFGTGGQTLVFAHGFGCDQQMWRFVTPAFEAAHRVVVFDLIGCGGADLAAYDQQRHGSLQGYADDLVEILEAADLRGAVLVGHSVSAMISMLAAAKVPDRVRALVMICPSPRYLNDPPDYVGGFEQPDIDSLIEMMEGNMLGWASFLAPAVMGPENEMGLTDELKASFCALDPYIARRFAEVTFYGDNRADLDRVAVPTLIIQVLHDAIAPPSVGNFVHRHVRNSELAVLDVSGHCPHMTHPAETTALIRQFLDRI